MSSRELLKAIGEIDDRFIDEAAEVISAARPAARRMRRRKWIALAACLLVAVGIGVMSLPAVFRSGNKADASSRGPSKSVDTASESFTAGNSSVVINSDKILEDDVRWEQNTEDGRSADPVSAEPVAAHVPEKDRPEEPAVMRDAARALWYLTINGR